MVGVPDLKGSSSLGRRLLFWSAAGLIFLAAAMVLALAIGEVPLRPGLVARILWLRLIGTHDLATVQPSWAPGVVLDIRLPRVMVGMAVGASLALAGVA